MRGALFAMVVCVALSGPAGAQAQPFTSSSITSPGNRAVLFYNGDQGSGSATIKGTVSPAQAGFGDLLCYTSATTPFDLADGIAVSPTGSFAADVSLSVIHGQACVLRFVPAGTTPTPNVAAAAFSGPAVSVSDQYSHATNGNLYGYDLLGGVLAFSYEFGSLGECPIRASFSTDPGSLSSYYLFDGNACLLLASGAAGEEGTRSAVQIDGSNAYTPGAIEALTGVAGFQPLSYNAAWNSAHDAVSITETDSLAFCSPPGTYPPTTSSCASLSPAGIVVEQTTTLLPSGQIARVSQRFVNTSDARQSLDLLFSQSVQAPASGDEPGFEFPGQSVFASAAAPESVGRIASGPGSIYVIADAADQPASSNPIGAITYGRPPLQADFVSAQGAQTATFLMHYAARLARHGSAGDSVTYNWSFEQAADVAALTPLIRSERDYFFKPSLSLLAPRAGVTATRSPITVRGVATDRIGIGRVSVNGHRATLRRDGGFVAKVGLHAGRNRIEVTASNLAGNTITKHATIFFRRARRHDRLSAGGR